MATLQSGWRAAVYPTASAGSRAERRSPCPVDQAIADAFFTDAQPSATDNNAFGGTSADAKRAASLGPLAELGATWSLDRHRFLDFSFSKCWIRTTATIDRTTPGAGDIERKMKVRTRPQVLSMTAGYRFRRTVRSTTDWRGLGQRPCRSGDVEPIQLHHPSPQAATKSSTNFAWLSALP